MRRAFLSLVLFGLSRGESTNWSSHIKRDAETCPSPTGEVATLISALSKLGEDSDSTKDLVDKYKTSSGLLGALSIQTTESKIAADAKNAVNAAKALTSLDNCESTAIISAIESAGPHIEGVLSSLVTRAADLISVGTKTIVADDLRSLQFLTAQLEDLTYSKLECEYLSQTLTSFEAINKAFGEAISAYSGTTSTEFPNAPSCGAATTLGVVSSTSPNTSGATVAATLPSTSKFESTSGIVTSSDTAGTSIASSVASFSPSAAGSTEVSASSTTPTQSCGPPTGDREALVSALSQLGEHSDKTKNLVDKYKKSSGLFGALSIQTSESKIARDAKNALAAANSLGDLNTCDSEAIVAAVKAVGPHIEGILCSLLNRAADLIAVGTRGIVAKDLTSLQSLTAQLEEVTYSKLGCEYLSQTLTSFEAINKAFDEAISAYSGTASTEFPSAPSCGANTTLAAVSSVLPSTEATRPLTTFWNDNTVPTSSFVVSETLTSDVSGPSSAGVSTGSASSRSSLPRSIPTAEATHLDTSSVAMASTSELVASDSIASNAVSMTYNASVTSPKETASSESTVSTTVSSPPSTMVHSNMSSVSLISTTPKASSSDETSIATQTTTENGTTIIATVTSCTGGCDKGDTSTTQVMDTAGFYAPAASRTGNVMTQTIVESGTTSIVTVTSCPGDCRESSEVTTATTISSARALATQVLTVTEGDNVYTTTTVCPLITSDSVVSATANSVPASADQSTTNTGSSSSSNAGSDTGSDTGSKNASTTLQLGDNASQGSGQLSQSTQPVSQTNSGGKAKLFGVSEFVAVCAFLFL